MSGRSFLDTNVLVYAFDDAEPNKRNRALALLDELAGGTDAVVSTQVLQEFYVTVTRKLERPLSTADAERAVRELARFPVVLVDTDMVLVAVGLSRRHRLSLWDSLIIIAAQRGGCSRLLTEDLQHQQQFGSLTVVNPFAAMT